MHVTRIPGLYALNIAYRMTRILPSSLWNVSKELQQELLEILQVEDARVSLSWKN